MWCATLAPSLRPTAEVCGRGGGVSKYLDNNIAIHITLLETQTPAVALPRVRAVALKSSPARAYATLMRASRQPRDGTHGLAGAMALAGATPSIDDY